LHHFTSAGSFDEQLNGQTAVRCLMLLQDERKRRLERMRKDYQFLIGQRFFVAGEIYVVQELTSLDEHIYVRAHVQADATDQADIVLSEPGATGAGRLFQLKEVIQSLLVEEEIELFHPNYLTAL
jgi:hypothetical protein